VVAEIVYLRVAEQLVPTTFKDSDPAHLLAAAATARHGSGDLRTTHAESTHADEPTASECDQRSRSHQLVPKPSIKKFLESCVTGHLLTSEENGGRSCWIFIVRLQYAATCGSRFRVAPIDNPIRRAYDSTAFHF
jgi:hypothetical protein